VKAGRVARARLSDHSSAQLASAQLAKSICTSGTWRTGAAVGATTVTSGAVVADVRDDAVAADAVAGLPAIAATTIKTMIADPRFPHVFLAMSFSLSPHISTRNCNEVRAFESTLRPVNSRCVPLQGEDTAQFTRSRDLGRLLPVPKSRSRWIARKKVKAPASQNMLHLPWRSPGDRPQVTGAHFLSGRPRA
jgi:hypothetical protein